MSKEKLYKAALFLEMNGYGPGTNFTLKTVANLLVQFSEAKQGEVLTNERVAITDQQSDLLPCPFCSNKNVMARRYGNGLTIGCDKCMMHTMVRLPSEAIENWNKRPSPPQETRDSQGNGSDDEIQRMVEIERCLIECNASYDRNPEYYRGATNVYKDWQNWLSKRLRDKARSDENSPVVSDEGKCTHENTFHKNIRCSVCKDCGELVEIDV
jgi:hypothetical protein